MIKVAFCDDEPKILDDLSQKVLSEFESNECAIDLYITENSMELVTIKNVIVNILSGALLPLWFMPEPILKIIKFTPFDSIFFTPVQLYLGQLQGYEIMLNFGRQLLWIGILYAIGELLWRKGIKRLVVQGG